jgi:hypothetical protein
MFTVWSTYYTEWEHQFGNQTRRADGQGYEVCNPVWSHVWDLDVLSKVRIFMWRALRGIVPGRSILTSKHMKVEAQCPVCLVGAEDMRHLLFTSLRAREVWKAMLYEYINQETIG